MHLSYLRDTDDFVVVQHEVSVPVCGPLVEDQDDEVAEDRVEKDDLRNEDEIERFHVLPVKRVHQLAAHAHSLRREHMCVHHVSIVCACA